MGDANGFGCLLATGRLGMVEYENCNFRGSFQAKKAPSFREARGGRPTPCSQALSSACLHPPSVVTSGFSTSQSFVSQWMFASRMSSISNLVRHQRVNLQIFGWGLMQNEPDTLT